MRNLPFLLFLSFQLEFCNWRNKCAFTASFSSNTSNAPFLHFLVTRATQISPACFYYTPLSYHIIYFIYIFLIRLWAALRILIPIFTFLHVNNKYLSIYMVYGTLVSCIVHVFVRFHHSGRS